VVQRGRTMAMWNVRSPTKRKAHRKSNSTFLVLRGEQPPVVRQATIRNPGSATHFGGADFHYRQQSPVGDGTAYPISCGTKQD